MSATAVIRPFGQDGKPTSLGESLHLPDYLDWMPIELKVFWYLERGFGDPNATHLLFETQGEQLLVPVTQTLRKITYKEMKEQEDGIREAVERYAREQGISRVPRNQ